MIAANKRAGLDYEIGERYEAGLELTGAEAKSFREGRVDITGSHVKVIGAEIYLINSNFYAEGRDLRRTRRLLMHKKEIVRLGTKAKELGLTLVPIRLYTTRSGRPGRGGRLVKLELGMGKPRRLPDKRKKLKDREIEREVARELKFR